MSQLFDRIARFWPARRRHEQETTHLLLLDESFRDPACRAVREAAGQADQACGYLRCQITVARSRGQDTAAMERRLTSLVLRAAELHADFRQETVAAQQRVWARYHNAIERGDDLDSVITPMCGPSPNARPFVIKAQEETVQVSNVLAGGV